jgi:hypothetical protein
MQVTQAATILSIVFTIAACFQPVPGNLCFWYAASNLLLLIRSFQAAASKLPHPSYLSQPVFANFPS